MASAVCETVNSLVQEGHDNPEVAAINYHRSWIEDTLQNEISVFTRFRVYSKVMGGAVAFPLYAALFRVPPLFVWCHGVKMK